MTLRKMITRLSVQHNNISMLHNGLSRSLEIWRESDNLTRFDMEKPMITESEPCSKRRRNSTRPPLPRSVCNIVIEYILEERKPEQVPRTPWAAWLEMLRETEFPSFANGITFRKRFLSWVESLDVKELEGKNVLCIKESRKTVPCKEELSRIIRDAHCESGEFAVAEQKSNADCKNSSSSRPPQIRHNPIEKCLRLIREKYAFGNKEFGIRRIHVYREVLRCPECYLSGRLKIPRKEIINEVEMIDPDFGNEMNFIMLKDAPLSMTMVGPTEHSVWYNQEGIASEGSLYKKLLGVISEIGIELGQTAQDGEDSRERLITKLCCAEKLVGDLKEDTEPVFSFKVSSKDFLDDYDALQNEYIINGKLGVFIYDVNILTNIYRRYRNEDFITKIDQGFKKLTENEDVQLTFSNDKDGLLLQGFKRKSKTKLHCGKKPIC